MCWWTELVRFRLVCPKSNCETILSTFVEYLCLTRAS